MWFLHVPQQPEQWRSGETKTTSFRRYPRRLQRLTIFLVAKGEGVILKFRGLNRNLRQSGSAGRPLALPVTTVKLTGQLGKI